MMKQPTKLLNLNFVLLWQGQFVSALGSQMAAIAVVFWIKHATGSAAAMGLIQMLACLPAVILGPVGGTFADRYSRRRIIILCDLLSGAALLSLAAVMFLLPESTGTTLVWLTAVFVLIGLISAFFQPAISAATPDLVPRSSITRANSLSQFSVQLSVFLGQGLGGTLFRLLGAPAVFLLDGLTFWFSAFSETFITIPQTIPEKSSGWRQRFQTFKQDTWDGFRYIWNKTGLRELVLVSAALGFFTMPVVVLLPFYVEDFLRVEADWYGYMVAAYGIGSLFGYVVTGWIRISGRSRCKFMLAFILLQSSGYGVLGMVREPFVAALLAFLGGAIGGFVTVHIMTAVQITTPTEIRGRTFGLLATISGTLAPVSMGLAGIVADLLSHNIPLIYLACGAAMTGVSLPLMWSKGVREFLSFEGEAKTAPMVESKVLPPGLEPE